MAQSRLSPFTVFLCMLLGGIFGCSQSSDGSTSSVEKIVLAPKAVSNWHGFPLSPGLPLALDSLVFESPSDALSSDQKKLLEPSGFSIAERSKARAVLGKRNTIRYLVVASTLSREAFELKWPKFKRWPVDFRDERTVWLLPAKRIQIHMSATPTGVELTYLPLTPLSMLVGPPTGTGFTFASYINKPVSAIEPILNRMMVGKTNGSRLGWANPLQFETVSLKVSIKVAPERDEIVSIDLFLKDDLAGSLRAAITTEVSRHWVPGPSNKTYTQDGAMLRVVQTPQLGLRRRNHRNLTLRFSKAMDAVRADSHEGRMPKLAPDEALRK